MSSRKSFERWAKSEGCRVVRNGDGSYDMPSTNWVWEGWKAATERAGLICKSSVGMKLMTIENGPDQLSAYICKGNE